jgi:hypothetical protein
MMELDFLIVAINQANFTIPDHMHAIKSVFSDNYDSVVRTVSNYQEIMRHFILFFDADDFARVLKVLALGVFYFLGLRLPSFCSVSLQH